MTIGVVILAGGLGKRMNSDLPKVLHELNDKTLIQFVIETANRLDPTKIGIIVGKYKEQIEQSINKTFDKDILDKIEYIIQEEAKGTGHAIQCSEEFIKNHERILILSGDVPLITVETLTKVVNSSSKCVILVNEFEIPTGYGRIVGSNGSNGSNGRVKIIEEKDCNEEEKLIKEINSGIYCFESKSLIEYLPKLECNNSQNEYYLTDIVSFYENVNVIKSENNNEILGVNTTEQLEKLQTDINLINNKYLIGIVGLGFVGSSIYKSLDLKGCQVKGYDKDENKTYNIFNDLFKCDILFLCLPTIYNEELKQYDKSCINETCTKLEEQKYNGIIIIKSTIEPQTTEELCKKFKTLRFIHNPEFLTAATAFYDFHNQTHIVIGKSVNSTNIDIEYLQNFYDRYYKGTEISICTSTESECMKSFVNCFYSVKIQFFNELYLLCQKIGTDYETIKKLMLRNGWINHMHTQVPGTDGKLSYGGCCFPKDTNALLEYMKNNNSPRELLEATISERNKMRDDNDNTINNNNKLNNNKLNYEINNEIIKRLLNREEININNINELNYLESKTILVTGGFGSIGSEIIRQLLNYNVKIIIYDNNECGYYNFKNEFKNYKNIIFILGCISNYNKVECLLSMYNIDIIYHVAAYKHVPILEENQYEAIKINVIGTKNIADLSLKYDIKKFIFISTDKAVNPTSVMGTSKRVSEMYIQYLWNKYKTTQFIITRFGNVLGSSGSVLPTFINNINNNINLELTDINITRYFMTISEAAKLVLLSSCICQDNKTVLFNMGEAIKIYDLAKNLLKMMKREDLSINIIGLRPGEKLYEELYYKNEIVLNTKYDKILLLKSNIIDNENFIENYNKLIQVKFNDLNIKELLKKIVSDYNYK
jgi:nucleoside-diphosphate-sugar epimerase/NDP-sugar pyrophosphorylase family protein